MDNSRYELLIFIYLLLLGYAFERSVFAFNVPHNKKTNQKKWLSTVPVLSYVFFFFVSVIEFSNKNILALNLVIFFIGCLILIFGIIFRYHAVLTFKKNNQCWFAHIEADKVNFIIVDGPYKYVRHPYYASVMSELMGIALALNSYISLFFILIIQGGLLCLRIISEEAELIKYFGAQYLDYKLRVGLFPRKEKRSA